MAASGLQAAPSFTQVFAAETPMMAQNGDQVPFGVRHASRQILQQRMKSVKNVSKITSAMKMVAASRLRGAQTKAEAARGIWKPMTILLGDSPDVDVAKHLNVAVTSDRGLCGGVNSNVAKQMRAVNAAVETLGEGEVEYFLVGEKARALLSKELAPRLKTVVVDTTKDAITFNMASLVAEEMLKTEADATRIIFNKFQSAISFVPTIATSLSAAAMEKKAGESGMLDEYEFEEDDRTETMTNLAEFQLAANLYYGMVENNASELGSRMSAMDSSTKNANEMLEKITLMFNRSRQAAITTELTEIISGAAALEG